MPRPSLGAAPMTSQELAREIDHLDRWEPGGVAGAIATWERRAAAEQAARTAEAERRRWAMPRK